MKQYVKGRLIDFVTHNILSRIETLQAEVIYQNLFNLQCLNVGVKNDFYPVGAAASHSLMYLLLRSLSEFTFDSIIELGSGQTTILIDRARQGVGTHTCYENDVVWHKTLVPKLSRCDYRLRSLTTRQFENVVFQGYSALETANFDLLLVDGPSGTDANSRFNAVELIEKNSTREFVLIFDDAERPGEQQTITFVHDWLQSKNVDVKLNVLSGRTRQAVFTTPRYRAISYYF